MNDRFRGLNFTVSRSYRPLILEELRSGNLDLLLAFRAAFQELDPEIVCRPLKHVSFCAVVRKDSELACREAVRPEDLRSSTLFMWERERNPAIYDAIIQSCTLDGIPPRTVVLPYGRDDILWPVVSGQGISIFSSGVLKDLPSALAAIPLSGFSDFDDRFCAFYRKDCRNLMRSYALELFVQAFQVL